MQITNGYFFWKTDNFYFFLKNFEITDFEKNMHNRQNNRLQKKLKKPELTNQITNFGPFLRKKITIFFERFIPRLFAIVDIYNWNNELLYGTVFIPDKNNFIMYCFYQKQPDLISSTSFVNNSFQLYVK